MTSNMTSISPIGTYYKFLFVDLADPRTNNWFLIKDPWAGLTIMGLYLYFCLNWGPKFMKHRNALEMKNILIVYNFFQVVVSTWLFCEALTGAWLDKYSWTCEPVDFSNTPHAMRVARGVYIYFLAKISELLDTVFFVLRKKESQITFLHMYHHTVMPMISWGATKYFPGGHGVFIGFINSFVHIIMYSYYLLAAFGPRFQKYLWWKKYITTMQLLQFCLAFIHSMQLFFYDCGYPRWSMCFTLPNAIFFYYLFNDFYKKAYNISDDPKEKRRIKDKSSSEKVYKKTDGDTQEETSNILENGKLHQNGHILNNGVLKNDLRKRD